MTISLKSLAQAAALTLVALNVVTSLAYALVMRRFWAELDEDMFEDRDDSWPCCDNPIPDAPPTAFSVRIYNLATLHHILVTDEDQVDRALGPIADSLNTPDPENDALFEAVVEFEAASQEWPR